MKIACIICTKDRPVDLENVLKSIVDGVRKPDQLIIVDGSDNPIENVVKKFPELNPCYVTVRPPGLAKQRNVGISKLNSDIEWVGFLDDDLVLEPECLGSLEAFISKKGNDLYGVGMVINNQPTFSYNPYRTIFLTDFEPGGVITPSGCASAIRPVKQDLEVDWLYGGATFWKKKAFEEFSFDEWFSGIGYLEDVDFSYRVSRKYKLMLAASARCWHYQHPIPKEKLSANGAWHLVSWWYFARKHDFNRVVILWSMFGIFLSNVIHGVIRPSSNRLMGAAGNLKAFKVIFSKKVSTFQGFQK